MTMPLRRRNGVEKPEKPLPKYMPKKPLPPNRLRELRTRGQTAKPPTLWLTIDEVAKVLGITKDHVSRHENRQRGISDEHLQLYAALYKVEPWHIFSGLTTDSPRR